MQTIIIYVETCFLLFLISVAAGPVGRTVEGDIAVRSPAAFYTYSKTRGLYAGISLVGTALIERKSANKRLWVVLHDYK